MPTKSTPDWTVDDALVLRTFLESATGMRTLAWLDHWAPALLDGSHVNKTLVASGEVKGYTAAIKHIISLTRDNPIEKPRETEYPDPDDDSKWTAEQSNRDNKS